MTKTTKRNLVTTLLFISPWVIGFLVFTLGPIVLSVYYSFSAYNVSSRLSGSGWTTTPPSWMTAVLQISAQHDYYTTLSVPGVLVLSLLLAAPNSRQRMNIFRTIYFLPQCFQGWPCPYFGWLFN